jgi:molecular chaperone DnaK
MELVTARNQLDALIHSTKKSMTEYGKELSDAEKSAIESALKDAEEAVKGDDKAAMDAKTEALAQAAQKLGEKMYAAEQAKAAGGGSTPGAEAGSKDEGDVVDAEFTEVKENK